MSTDDLDQIGRLHALRASGHLTDEEFQSEKTRILGPGRVDHPAFVTPVAERDVRVEPIPRYGDTTHNRRALGIALVLVVVAGVASGLWLWRNQANTGQPIASASEIAATASQPSIAPSVAPPAIVASKTADLPSNSPAQAQSPPAEWSVRDDDKDFFAIFAPPSSDFGYSLACHSDKRSITFAVLGSRAKTGPNVIINVGNGEAVGATALFADDGISSVEVSLPAYSAPYTDLISGRSPLWVKWSDGGVNELPNAPMLQDFLKKCRERSGR